MFGVAILVMLLSACLAETAGYFDKNGGAMQYSKAAFGDFVGFNVGILGWGRYCYRLGCHVSRLC